MKKFKTAIFVLLLINSVYSSMSWADTGRRFPNGCRTEGVIAREGLVVFQPDSKNGKRQALYFVHNISNQTIHFTAKKSPDRPFSPPYKNAIKPNRWGAFATDMKEMAFICSKGSHEMSEKVNCADVLEICQYTNVKFGASNGGNYWVVKSDSMQGAMRGAIHIGILLRW